METGQKVIKETEDKMVRCLDAVTREFQQIRGGRAAPAMLDSVIVDYYGAQTPLKQLAQITAPEPRLLVVQPWDKGSLAEIEGAINKAGVGVSPVNDGNVIRLPLPQLTEERRAELEKLVRKLAEDGRVSVRGIRRDANDAIKKLQKDKTIAEDQAFTFQDRVQKVTDKHIHEIDALLKRKEEELHSV